MSSPAQLSANIANAQHSTGPRTDQGKAASSQNAVKSGLFSTRDFIRPGEESIYTEFADSLFHDLSPVGALELGLTEEIRRAIWRLRRCAETEAAMLPACIAAAGGLEFPIPDPLQIEATAQLQRAVDRARAQSHRILHRCTAELRKLQTERHFRVMAFGPKFDSSFLGIADTSRVGKNLSGCNPAVGNGEPVSERDMKRKTEREEEFDRMLASDDEIFADFLSSKTSPTKQTRSATAAAPRNSRCACGSGLKFKRCCAMKAAA